MTAKTGLRLTEKKHLSPLSGIGNCAVVAVEMVAIIRRARRDDAPFKTRDRFYYIGDGESIRLFRKRPLKQNLVLGVGAQGEQKAIAWAQTKLDWVLAEHRHERLILQSG